MFKKLYIYIYIYIYTYAYLMSDSGRGACRRGEALKGNSRPVEGFLFLALDGNYYSGKEGKLVVYPTCPGLVDGCGWFTCDI